MFVKIALFLVLGGIAYGDFKERLVWNIYFWIFGLLGCYLFFNNANTSYFLFSIASNLLIIGSISLVLFLISKYYLKKNFLKEVLGLGDLLFFIGFAVSFPITSFFVFFVFSVFFTLVFFLVLKKISVSPYVTVPLAGTMSIFLMAVYLIHWLGWYENIYLL